MLLASRSLQAVRLRLCGGRFPASLVRLRVLRVDERNSEWLEWFSVVSASAHKREGVQPVLSVHVEAFGLLRDDCPIVRPSRSDLSKALPCLGLLGNRAASIGGLPNNHSDVVYQSHKSGKLRDNSAAIATATLRSGGDMTANGYFFALRAIDLTVGGDFHDLTKGRGLPIRPAGWVVETSKDGGTTWNAVGASVWRIVAFSQRSRTEVFPDLDFRGRTQLIGAETALWYCPWAQAGLQVGAMVVKADLRPPIGWFMASAIVSAVVSIGFIALAFWSWRERSVRTLCAATFALAGLVGLASAASYDLEWMWRESLLAAARALLFILLGLVVWATKSRIIYLTGAWGAADSLTTCALEVTLYDVSCATAIYSLRERLGAPVLAAITGIFLYCSARAAAHAHQVIKPDQIRYDEAWVRVKDAPGGRQALAAIKEEVSRISSAFSRCSCVQRQLKLLQTRMDGDILLRSRPAVGCTSKIPRSASWNTTGKDNVKAVTDLDQLFVQARCLHPILQCKVAEWALASKGCFPIVQRGLDLGAAGTRLSSCKERSQLPSSQQAAFGLYEDAVAVGKGSQIRWAAVKSVGRAVEKCCRVYMQASGFSV